MSPRQKTTFTYEYAVLGFLSAAPMHAYALHQTIVDSSLGKIWHIKQSAFYAIVARMADAGFLCGLDHDDDGRGKRMLACTPQGVAVFQSWCCAAVGHARDMRIEFLAKLYFCTLQGSDAVTLLYVNQVSRCHDWLLQCSNEASPDPFLTAVQRYRYGQIQAIIAWMEAYRPTT
jgi:DNA-binding PadR family transcriptional regulator